jgi:thymidylate synthase ThyX
MPRFDGGAFNLDNLLKFVSLRLHDGAQWEIQKVAEACLEIATDLFPITVGAYSDNIGAGKISEG